jgi:hypothetical protein
MQMAYDVLRLHGHDEQRLWRIVATQLIVVITPDST